MLPLNGMIAPGRKGSPGSIRASCASTQPDWRCAQSSAARRLTRLGQVKVEQAARFVEPQPQRAGSRMRA